jgi:PLAC8 family
MISYSTRYLVRNICTSCTTCVQYSTPYSVLRTRYTSLHVWKAEEGPPEETAMTFNRIVMTIIFVLAFGAIPFVVYATFLVAILCFMYIGMKLRRYMRTKYEIPHGMLGKIHPAVDDVCCILFCTCCSGIQMARHTHDDKEWPGSCCTTNGLEYGAPEIV